MKAQDQKTSIDARLALVKRNISKTSHIEVHQEEFRLSRDKAVLFLCPAKVYTLNQESGECVINYENCIECGTCQVACPEYISWKNPPGVFGVSYKYG